MVQRMKVVRDIFFLAPIPPDDVAAIANEQVVYVPDENCRNLSREAKLQ